MKFTLKDYQSDAVAEALSNLADARDFFHRDKPRVSSFALTATTGAGKTVMAAAVIEALFGGNDDLDFEPDSTAVVLWFSDDPSLNEQTRFRLLEASDRIGYSNLVVVEHPFYAEKFKAGKVYFLNTAKLSKTSLLTRGHIDENEDHIPGLAIGSGPDLQAYTVWETIKNTIEDPNLTLYMVLDEAHRGMGTSKVSKDKPTIVKRLINGHAGFPPMPVVWGISATVERFEAAMKAAEVSGSRMTLPRVSVDSRKVQESGLLKDDIILDFPTESGAFDTVLLRRATRKIVDSTKAWSQYAAEQGDTDPVVPLMVLQSPNTPDPHMLKQALDVIFEEWGDLTSDAVAHVFGEHVTKEYGPWVVPHISPERVQDAKHIRVLIAKDAISTGWDCPRSEVMISFRPAKDATHITQLLGRMVRTPLARRVPGNEKLNAVECILPFFDRKTASDVVDVLMGVSDGLPDPDKGRRILIRAEEMLPNASISEEVWEALEAIPSESQPKRTAKPVKRLTALAQALARDGLRLDAGKEAHAELHAVLDGLAARYKPAFQEAIDDILTMEGGTVAGHRRLGKREDLTFSEHADDLAIQASFRAAARVFTADVARTYVDHLAPEDPDAEDDGLRDAYVHVAALAKLPNALEDLDSEAERVTRAWLDQYRVAIKGLSDERQQIYNDIRAMSTAPQRISLIRPQNRMEETKRKDANNNEVALPYRTKHLLSDSHGNFPVASLNEWELSVLDIEMTRSDTLAWYRNPSRSSADSLGIAFYDVQGAWRTMRPDFLFFSVHSGQVKVSIVDPHGHHFSDALPKLKGLARFAAEYGPEFHRIEAVAKVNNKLRVLDLTNEKVRQAIEGADSAEALYSGPSAHSYT
ncbi:DEAD/DEAH box helicase [Nonomuraea sp. NPDC050022]|uniref:DEAD/DEAH box helicase n=1 Tax=Nonomuraea sp. NPDC050022 TaxID=3364358 RepID=UPI0037AA50B1